VKKMGHAIHYVFDALKNRMEKRHTLAPPRKGAPFNSTRWEVDALERGTQRH